MRWAVWEFLSLIALIFVGSWGWGAGVLRLAERLDWPDAREQLGTPIQIALGMALFCCVGGMLVAVNEAWFVCLVGWHVIGVVLLGADHFRGWSRRVAETLQHDGGRLALVALVAALGTFATLGNAIGNAYYNYNDDDPAYIYLAHRLLQTGGLIDPFNQRRLAGYGGATLYQAMILQVSGNSSTRGFEYFVAILLLGLLAFRTVRRSWAPLAALVIGAAVLLGYEGGQVTNEAPVFSCAVLTLAVLQVLTRMRDRSATPSRSYYAIVGILLAGLLALRTTDLVAPLVATVIVYVLRARRREIAVALGTSGLSGLVGASGWAIATFRSSRTLLFPLMLGNYDPSYPGSADPTLRFGDYVSRFRLVLSSIGFEQTLAVALVGSVLLLLARRDSRSDAIVLAAAAVGCVVELVLLVRQTGGSPIESVVRFVAPSFSACALLVVDLYWPIRVEPAVVAVRRDLPTPRHVLGHVVSAAVILLALAEGFGHTAANYRLTFQGDEHLGTQVLTGNLGFADRYAHLRGVYDDMNDKIPRGAYVLSAVDYPALLDLSRFRAATLDIVGSVSPAPHLPIFRGATAIVSYLRALGFDYVLVDLSTANAPGLYNEPQWAADLQSPVVSYRKWAPYFIRWDAIATQLASSKAYPVVHVGYLALVQISQPPTSTP